MACTGCRSRKKSVRALLASILLRILTSSYVSASVWAILAASVANHWEHNAFSYEYLRTLLLHKYLSVDLSKQSATILRRREQRSAKAVYILYVSICLVRKCI